MKRHAFINMIYILNPQIGVPNFGIPSYEQMRAAFNSIEQQQQMWYNNQHQQFQIFCQTRGLNPNDQKAFNLFYNQLVSNMGQQQSQQPQQLQVFPQSQSPQVFPQPQSPQVFPQSQSPQNFYQPHPSQVFTQPHPFIPQIPHGIPPGQGNGNKVNEPYIHGNLTEKLPRGDKTVYIKPDNKNASDIINIALRASSGLNVILAIPSNLPIREMFKRYVEKLGLPYGYLGNDIQFLYNGNKVDPFSNEPVSSKFKNGINITVYDQAGVIGAA